MTHRVEASKTDNRNYGIMLSDALKLQNPTRNKPVGAFHDEEQKCESNKDIVYVHFS